jgi:hypothetical protein
MGNTIHIILGRSQSLFWADHTAYFGAYHIPVAYVGADHTAYFGTDHIAYLGTDHIAYSWGRPHSLLWGRPHSLFWADHTAYLNRPHSLFEQTTQFILGNIITVYHEH